MRERLPSPTPTDDDCGAGHGPSDDLTPIGRMRVSGAISFLPESGDGVRSQTVSEWFDYTVAIMPAPMPDRSNVG